MFANVFVAYPLESPFTYRIPPGMEVLPERENGRFVHKGLYNIGINNVKERIRMNYGKEYGLYIEGRSGLYTKVTLQLPLIGRICD